MDVRLAWLLFCYGLAGSFAAAQDDGLAALESLQKVDAAYATALTATGVERIGPLPIRPADPGGVFDWRLTRNSDEIVLHRVRRNGDIPAYVPQGKSNFIDYDDQGNMIAPVLVEEILHFSSTERFQKQRYLRFTVSTGGSVVDRSDYDSVTFFRPDDDGPTLSFKRALWSVGRGFGPYLEELTESHVRDDGLIDLVVLGTESPVSHGIWKLTIDPVRSYLVTSASYTRDGKNQPTIALKNSGSQTNASCDVAEQAQWTVNVGFTAEQTVECGDASFRVDEELLEFGRNAKGGPFADNATGLDKRSGSFQRLDLHTAKQDRIEAIKPVSRSRVGLFVILLNVQVLVLVLAYWLFRRTRRPLQVRDGNDQGLAASGGS